MFNNTAALLHVLSLHGVSRTTQLLSNWLSYSQPRIQPVTQPLSASETGSISGWVSTDQILGLAQFGTY